MPVPAPIAIPGFADPFSSLSNLVGALVFAVLSVPLLRKGLRTHHGLGRGAGVGHVASLAIFAGSAVMLLSFSGVYHMLGPGGPARAVLQRLDHAAIFVLIAGTFTPIHAILFRGPWRWGMLAFVWTLAAAGVTLKSVFFTQTPPALGLSLYIGMGWVGVVSTVLLARRLGVRPVLPLAFGGVVYTAGAVIDGVGAPVIIPGTIRAHELFHIAVLLGLALQWWFVWRTADVRTAATRPLALDLLPPQPISPAVVESRPAA